MKDITSVIVPVDFLKHTDKLVDYSISMAGKLSAVIHFLHVVSFPTGDAMMGAPFAADYEGKMLADAQARMSNLIEDNSEKCKGCTGEVVVGEPAEKIVEIAKAKGSDLVIMCTHGAKGLEKILLGSVTERVLKRADCPLLIMNPFKTK